MRLTFANTNVLDHLLLKRFGGKVGRGFAIELSLEHDYSAQAEFRAAPILTGYGGKDELFDAAGHNDKIQTNVCSKR